MVASSQALHSMEEHIDALPLLPQVMVRILQLDASADNYFEQFEQLASEDPAFAVRIVALANSASSSPIEPVCTIRDALTRMGAARVTSFVASLSVQRVFMPTESSQVGLWKHAIETAVSAKRIAQIAPHLQVDPAQAYLVGLLHDIGRFVMLEHAAPELRRVDESDWDTPEDLIEADLAIYHFTHSELGYLACKHWCLPDVIGRVIRTHHDALPDKVSPGSMDAERFCVQVADRISIMLTKTEDLDDLDEAATLDLIRERCLACGAAEAVVTAAALSAELDWIRSESARLFANLGFH